MKAAAIGFALVLACAGGAVSAESGGAIPAQYAEMVTRHAKANGVPEALVHRIIMRESRYNPKARNGPYWGMMQMSIATARGAGFRGSPSELLDADTNLRFGVRYLAGAYKTARGDHGRAVGFYARGYYYAAKAQGMLAAIGMGRNGHLTPPPASSATPVQVAAAPSTLPTVTPAEPVLASVSTPARTSVPTPPARGVVPAPAAGPTVTAAAAIPLPPVRGPVTTVAGAEPPKATAPRTINPSAAPVMAAMTPVPRPRDEPSSTGSIRAQSPRSGATTPTGAATTPVAGPAIPLPTPRDEIATVKGKIAPQQPLAYAAQARAETPTPIPAPRGPVPPTPPRR